PRRAADVMPGHVVREVDHPHIGGDPGDDPVADADEVVAAPIVAHERDEHGGEGTPASWTQTATPRLASPTTSPKPRRWACPPRGTTLRSATCRASRTRASRRRPAKPTLGGSRRSARRGCARRPR